MRTVLIVEDDEAIAYMLQELLEMEGYTALATFHGRAALRLLPQVRPDLIVTDVSMPEMDGYELCAAIQAQPHFAAIPIILMTALHSPVAPAALARIICLQKPFLPEVLLQTVQAVLHEGEQAREWALG